MNDSKWLIILFIVMFIIAFASTTLIIIMLTDVNMYYDTGILTEPTGYSFKLDGHIYYYDYYYCSESITSFNNTCVKIKYESGCGQMIISDIECICSCECE